jgi:hypothetical protein
MIDTQCIYVDGKISDLVLVARGVGTELSPWASSVLLIYQ